MSTSHLIASFPLCIIFYVILMCLTISSATSTPTVLLRSNGTEEDYSATGRSLNSVVGLMNSGDSIRVKPGYHRQALVLEIDTDDVTFYGGTSNPKDTCLVFTTQYWMYGKGTRLVFENLLFTGMRRSADLTGRDITFKNCVFETSVTQPVMHIVDPVPSPWSTAATPTTTLTIEDTRIQHKVPRTNRYPAFKKDVDDDAAAGGLLHFNLRTSHVVMKKTYIYGGQAKLAGCVYIRTAGDALSKVSFTDSLFMDCIAEQDGGAAFLDLVNTHPQSTVSFMKTEFYYNRALRNGGAVYVKKITPVDDTSSPTVDYRISSLQLGDLEFIENMAYSGGALYMSQLSVSRLHTDSSKYLKFLRNEAVARGGAMYTYSGQHFALDISLTSNKVGWDSTRTALDKYTSRPSSKIPTDHKGLEYGGGLYIAAHAAASSSSSSTTTLVFKANRWTASLNSNVAKSGGGIYSETPIHITNLYSRGNVAWDGNGGSLYLADNAVVENSHMFKDKAKMGKGGAIHMMGDDSSVSNVKIFGAASEHGGSAIYYAPHGNGSTLSLKANTLIYGDESENLDSAVLISSNSCSVTFTSNDVEYRNNGGGHLKLAGSSPIVYTSTDDYFDASSLQNGKPSLVINALMQKSLTRTFFDGMCSVYPNISAKTILEECTTTASPQNYPGGWWGLTAECSFTGEACQAPSNPDTCEDTRKCVLDGVGSAKQPKKYAADAVSRLVPGLTTTTQAPTGVPTTTSTTTSSTTPVTLPLATSTTTIPPSTSTEPATAPSVTTTQPQTVPVTTAPTPPGVVTKANVCEGDNKTNIHATLGETRYATRSGCEDRGYCYIAATSTTRWRCFAPEASGHNDRTPGTTCNVAPRDRQVAGWRGASTYDICVKRGGCWVPPATGEFGPSCFWGKTHGLDTTQ